MAIILGDGLRVIAIVLYMACIPLAIYIFIIHFQLWHRFRRRPPGRRATDGQVPHHVYLMALSFILYASGSIVWSFFYWGNRPTPFGFVNIFAGVTGLPALVAMFRISRARHPRPGGGRKVDRKTAELAPDFHERS